MTTSRGGVNFQNSVFSYELNEMCRYARKKVNVLQTLTALGGVGMEVKFQNSIGMDFIVSSKKKLGGEFNTHLHEVGVANTASVQIWTFQATHSKTNFLLLDTSTSTPTTMGWRV